MNRLWQVYQIVSALIGILIGAAVFAACCLSALGAETNAVEAAAVTNIHITTETVTLPGWYKRIVYTDETEEPKNDEGVIVSAADAKAQETVIEYAGEISEAAEAGLGEAVSGMLAVTNQIPTNATHIALSLGRYSESKNLAGEVIGEWSDGTNDWQVVRYNQLLTLAPGRKVRYSFVDQTNDIEFVWNKPWDASSLVHTGMVARPVPFRGVRALSWRHERFGGVAGFDFGSAVVGIVTNGVISYALTTNFVINLDGVLFPLSFKNGAYIGAQTQNEGEE